MLHIQCIDTRPHLVTLRERDHFGRTGRRWEDDIVENPRQIWHDMVYWNKAAPDKV